MVTPIRFAANQALSKSEYEFVAKGGLDKFKDDAMQPKAEKGMAAGEGIDKSAEHDDAEEDEKMMTTIAIVIAIPASLCLPGNL
jgi:hypothetical protein